MPKLIHCILVVLLAAPCWPQEPADAPRPIEELRPTHPDTPIVVDGQANAAIVVPDTHEMGLVGRRVAARIRSLTGADLPLFTSTDAPSDVRDWQLVLLGNMANNPVLFDLYLQHYTACDLLYPGEGGYVVRSVHDPWGKGYNAIVLGGSDAGGVSAAADAFLAGLRPGTNLRVPRLMDIQLPGIEGLTPAALKKQQDAWRKRFVKAKGLWYGATHDLCRIGELYHLTGKEAYAQLFAQMARRWIQEYRRWSPHRQITTPKYAMPRLMLTWDLVEESAFVPTKLKLDMLNLLYDYTCRMARHSRIKDWPAGQVRETGHLVCLSVLYGARYFRKHYPDLPHDAIDQGLHDIATGMATLAQTPAVLSEDGYWHFHPETIVHYSMATGERAFFRSGMAAKMCEYAALCTSPLGSFHGHMSEAIPIVAWLSRDPRWQWLATTLDPKRGKPTVVRDGNLVCRPWSFPSDVRPQPPLELAGLMVFPLDATVYDNIVKRRGATPVPRERAFRQAALRSGLTRHSQYLLLDGVNLGLHQLGDGHSVRAYCDRGAGLLTSGKWGATEMKYQNTVLVRRCGRAPESIPVLAELLLQADLAGVGFLQSKLPDYAGTTWVRSIVWIKDACVLVADTLKAHAPDRYDFACQWRTMGEPSLEGRAMVHTRSGTTFVVRSSSGPVRLVDDDGVRVMRTTSSDVLNWGQSRSFAHVLYAKPDASLPRKWTRWQSSPQTARLDQAGAHRGQACATVRLDAEPSWRCLVQTVARPEDVDRLILTAAARTNGGIAARVYVSDPQTRSVLARIDFADEAWTNKSLDLDLPRGIGPKLEVWLSTTHYAAEGSQVWFDDVGLWTQPAAADAQPGRARKNLVANGGFEKAEDHGRPGHDYDVLRLSDQPSESPSDAMLLTTDREPALCVVAQSPIERTLAASVTVHASMALVEPTRFAAAQATRLTCGPELLESSGPLSIELDLATGLGVAVCDEDVQVTLPCPEQGPLTLNASAIAPRRSEGRVWLALTRGRHVFHLPPFDAKHEIFAQVRRGLTQLELAAPDPDKGPAAAGAFPPPVRWKWDEAKGAINAVAVAKLEPTGPSHVAVGSADGKVYLLSNEGKTKWSFSPGSPVNDVLMADLDRDGRTEILACCDNYRVYCLDGAGKKRWEFSNQKFEIKHQLPGEYGTGRYVRGDGEFLVMRAADLDGDGELEVLAGARTFRHGKRRVFGTLFALKSDGKVLWHTYQSGGNPSSLDLTDVDGDGRPEIALATGGPTYARSNYLLSSAGELVHRFRNAYGPERIRFARLTEAGGLSLVAADERSGLVSVFDAADPYGTQWTFPTGAFRVSGLHAVDTNGSGTDEIVVTTLDGDVYALSAAAAGHTAWRRSVQFPVTSSCLIPGLTEATPPFLSVGGADGSLALVGLSGVTLLGSVDSEVTHMVAGDLTGSGWLIPLIGTRSGALWCLHVDVEALVH